MKNPVLTKKLDAILAAYRINGKVLPGISTVEEREALVAQIVDSVARIDYIKAIATRPISLKRLDPKDAEMFDPLRAAVHHMRNGNVDEAFWLVFLFVVCGKHLKKGYGLLRMVYGAYNDKFTWTWDKFSRNPNQFTLWLHQHLDDIEAQKGDFPFGNHRKYESRGELDIVLKSYAAWIGPKRSHATFIANAKAEVGDDPKKLFDYLYKKMKAVQQFGRTGKFDYLTMIAKVGLVDIEPPSAYIIHATGPERGARLLFSGAVDNKTYSKKKLDELAIELEKALGVGMQVIEDSLCNWQKSPAKYKPFRG
ncbi:hypothetical protein WT24_17255 [Burkholderia sp. MSMB1078WGS]|uniref:alpha-glutamyl/putrescinyl thymine pyrophosphorylase clade 3 protein n=1 Tax=Burkholderia sp. MSMB1078WGS TaxID=1637900 RepID=UPI000758F078|nr:hypothetical protein [Burkholderia sp. MSMB1078WGS]KVT08106.1 hypothetical protein WT24_17255 [Burkholderia sp. MSMB1078WGS]